MPRSPLRPPCRRPTRPSRRREGARSRGQEGMSPRQVVSRRAPTRGCNFERILYLMD
ncbi:unnamed protein product [Bubo scandiacus]